MTFVEVEKVAFGGDGIARSNGLVIFVPFSLPNEEVQVHIEQKKKQFARASLLNIIKKSPDRVPAPCPYFTACGGCQLQHATYLKQLELKKCFVEDSFSRIGKISFTIPPITPSEKPYSYRRHLSLQIHCLDHKWGLCFSSVKNTPIKINSCELFHEKHDPILEKLQIKFSQIPPSFPLEGRAKLLKGEKGYNLALTLQKNLSSIQEKTLFSLFEHLVEGLWIKTPEKTISLNDRFLSFSCLGLDFSYSPFSFIQNHPEQSEAIYALVVHLLENSYRVLDLYCGIGISTLLLTKKGKKTIGLEISEESILWAKKNSERNNLFPEKFIAAPAEELLTELLVSFEPNAVLVNPPKTGLPPEVRTALQNPCIKQIVYVSCHPPTLARDLADLTHFGFSINFLQSFDCFPQTTHVETVVNLVRN